MLNTVEIKYSCVGKFPEIYINGEVISRYMSLADYIYDDIFRWADQFYSIIDGELAEDYKVVLIGHPFQKKVLELFLNKSEFCKDIEFKAIESKIPYIDKYNFACDLNTKYTIIPNFNKVSLLLNCKNPDAFTQIINDNQLLTTESSDYAILFDGDELSSQSKYNIVISQQEKIENLKNSTTFFVEKQNIEQLIDYLNIYHFYLPTIEDTFTKLPNVALDVASKLEFEAYSKEEYRYIFDAIPDVMEAGEQFEIKYDYFPKCFEKPSIKVFVDNPSVVMYENGTLNARDKGKCEIRICDFTGTEQLTKIVDVNKHNFATNITIVLPDTKMNIGETLNFRCIVSPNDAEDANELHYSVNNDKVAVLSGKNELYAVSAGRVCVTVSTQRVSKKFYITVLSNAVGIATSGDDIEVPCSAQATIYCAPIPFDASPTPVIEWSVTSNRVIKIVSSNSNKCVIFTQNPGVADLLCHIKDTDIYKHIKITVPKMKGCYVATSVYGSYDCPEVWVLRRFRDNYLEKYALGRLFISAYYAVSPTIVKLFGKYNWFNNLFRLPLNQMVAKLRKNGYEDTPYKDGR